MTGPDGAGAPPTGAPVTGAPFVATGGAPVGARFTSEERSTAPRRFDPEGGIFVMEAPPM